MSPQIRGTRNMIWVISLALLFIYLCVGMALRYPIEGAKVPVSGDEQHYLTIAISLLEDGDAYLVNNYEQGDYLEFYPNVLDPSLWNLAGGKGFSGHSPGTGLLVVPGLHLAGWFGVIVTMSLAMASAFTMSAFTLRRMRHGATTSKELLPLASGFAALPLLPYSHTLYPETFMAPIVAALALLAVIYLQAQRPAIRIAAGVTAISIASLSLGLHPKYVLVAIAATAFFIVLEILDARKGVLSLGVGAAVTYVAVLCLWLILFSWIHDLMWDTFHPLGWWPQLAEQRVGLDSFLIQLLDLLFGSTNGIFFLVPLTILAIGFLMRAMIDSGLERRFGVFVALVAGFIVGPSAFSYAWFAGDSPVGRYLAPIVTILLVAAVLAVARQRASRGRNTIVAIVVTAAVSQIVLYAALPLEFRPQGEGGGSLSVLANQFGILTNLESWAWSSSREPLSWMGLVAFVVVAGLALWPFVNKETAHPTQATPHEGADTADLKGTPLQ